MPHRGQFEAALGRATGNIVGRAATRIAPVDAPEWPFAPLLLALRAIVLQDVTGRAAALEPAAQLGPAATEMERQCLRWIAGFIGYACWEIFKSTSGILADRFVIPEEAIREVVRTVPEVEGCHHIRTRGSNDFVFLDLHVWMDRDMRLDEAHRLSHVVKDRLMARFPQIKDAIIHIEPPPREGEPDDD